MKNNENKNNKKLIIGGAVAAIAIAGSVVMVGGDFFEKDNKPSSGGSTIVTKPAEKTLAKYNVEYGEKIEASTFTVEGMSVKMDNLTPKVDSNKVGKNEHTTTINGKELLITISVVDTNAPEFSGIKDYTFPKGTEIQKELKSKISASDKVDGALEYTLTTVEKDSKTEVTVSATDKNGNETKEVFNVILSEKSASVDKDGDKVVAVGGNVTNSDGGNVSKPTTPTKPVEKPVATKPVEKPVQTKPVEKPVQTKPVEKPVQTKPVEKPVQTKPVEKPVQTKPVEKPVVTKPVEKPVQTKPVEKPVQTKPVEKPSTSVPTKIKDIPGAAFTSNDGLSIDYKYNKSLSSGGKIKTVSVGYTLKKNVEAFAIGVDKNGESFFASQEKGSNTVQFQFSSPNLTEEDMSDLMNIFKTFLDAHK